MWESFHFTNLEIVNETMNKKVPKNTTDITQLAWYMSTLATEEGTSGIDQ